nr:carboxymuconolactone decarboxylase family protein [candidate division Zixibacteria bacterium]
MAHDKIEIFRKERERLNDLVLANSGTTVKRYFNLDWQAYSDGALPAKTKELLGLVASLVLRCDDCILYHVIRCREEGITDQELEECLAVGLVVGGSITIPHIRQVWNNWENLRQGKNKSESNHE